MVLHLPRAQKRMIWAFEKSIFQIFVNFWVPKLKAFSGKVRQSVRNYLNQNLVKESFLENGFAATLSSKTNVLSVWIAHFSVFCKFLSEEVETVCWESEAKRSKLFKSKSGYKKLHRKCFCSYLRSKMNVLNVWKLHFSVFCRFFELRS